MSLTGLAFLLAFTAGLGLALVRHPIYGLYTYIAVFYLHPPSRWWGAFLPEVRWALVAAAVTVVATIRLPRETAGRQPWYTTGPAILLLCFTAWLWLQNLWALDSHDHYEASVLFSKFIVVYYMIYRLIDSGDKARDFLLLHVLGCFYLAWVAYTSVGSGRLDGVGGPGIDDANSLGMQVATGLVAGAMLMITQRGWRRMLPVIATPFIMNVILVTRSRGAFLSMLAGGLFLTLLKPRGYKKAFYAMSALTIVLFAYLATDVFWDRMASIRSGIESSEQWDTSASGRIEQAKAGLLMARKYPFGTGHRGFSVLSPQYLDSSLLTIQGQRSSHNTVVTILVEQGIPGVVLMMLLIAWIARTFAVARRLSGLETSTSVAATRAAAFAGLVVVFIGGMFVDFLKMEVQVWLAAILASLAQPALLSQAVSPEFVTVRSPGTNKPAKTVEKRRR